MRAVGLLSCLALLWLASFAQRSYGQDTSNGNSTGNGGTVTIEGCVTSINGYFSLETRTGLIRLKGDHDSLLGHNGQQVRVTGTLTSAKKNKPRTLTISDLKKVADTCQY